MLAALLLTTSLPSSALDVTAFKVQREEIKRDAKELSRAHDYYSEQRQQYQDWQNVLTIVGTGIRVPLARTAITKWLDGSIKDFVAGLDTATLKIRWLEEGKLLWISWRTLSRGSGLYNYDGHVILKIDGNSARELFRDNFNSYARGGWAAGHQEIMDVSFEPKTAGITIIKQQWERDGGNTPLLLGSSFENDDLQTLYLRDIAMKSTWRYRVTGDRLQYVGGMRTVEFGEGEHRPEEVAAFFKLDLQTLKASNPVIGKLGHCSGSILLDDHLPVCQTSDYDGLYGNQ